jgi:hypothetical protein
MDKTKTLVGGKLDNLFNVNAAVTCDLRMVTVPVSAKCGHVGIEC